jgi:thiamine biosynthesis protein ThiS
VSATCSVVVNGDSVELGVGSSVLELLDTLGRDPRTVAVELNGEVLTRDRFGEITLSAGDRLELVRFVQGGTGSWLVLPV